MDVISDRLAKQYPEFDHGVTAEVKPLHDFAVQNVRQSLLVLLAAVGFVLLIACANVANLLLARASAASRRSRSARRSARAARGSRASCSSKAWLLALAGGAAGLLLAFWTVPLLAALAGANTPAAAAIAIDPTALAFTIAVSIATGFVFGLAPGAADHARRRRGGDQRRRPWSRAPAPATIACDRCSSWPRWRWRRCCWSARGC